ncbi:MAG: hypothetical protein RL662_1241 [Bacteroidota bacterium]|jgi:phosphoribosylglycinamide formyltransferase-1
MINIAIFASGSGTNAENIISYFKSKESDIQIKAIISNRSDAYVLLRAERANIESAIFSKQDFVDTPFVLDFLKEKQINFIVLAGFLLKVPENIIKEYPHNIINIHPALLPKHGGKGMYGDRVHRAVIESQDKESGITIHHVNENYDEGSIIFQATCPITPDDTYTDVANKVHALEYKYYPQIIEEVILAHQST